MSKTVAYMRVPHPTYKHPFGETPTEVAKSGLNGAVLISAGQRMLFDSEEEARAGDQGSKPWQLARVTFETLDDANG